MRLTTTLSLLLISVLLATAGEWREYSWSPELPQKVAVSKPAANRTVQDVDALFASVVTVDAVLARLGRPDAFTRQALGSKTFGTAEPQERGGTLRFDLAAAMTSTLVLGIRGFGQQNEMRPDVIDDSCTRLRSPPAQR
jgi:hypothetical protein